VIFILGIYIIISETIFIKTLQSEFEIHRNFYKRFMPDEVMNAEKIVRA